MLTPWLSRGFGLAEVVNALSRELGSLGIPVIVGVMDEDRTFSDVDARQVPADAAAITRLAAKVGATVVVAHGSPYLEILPDLPLGTIAYEHGDPTPEMFGDDAAERRRMVNRKQTAVYPRVDAVVAISEFIRHDIDWPSATVITNGVDHIPDQGRKTLVPPRPADKPLRVGTLMRLGPGEVRYKGNDLLPLIREQAQVRLASFEVMGSGTETDAAALRSAGFVVHLNTTDEQRLAFLRGIDVFVTASRWEGCNLPLLEAQSLGTPGLAFDTGAHPEFTPFVFSSVALMAHQLAAYGLDPGGLLRDHGDAAYEFVRSRFTWEAAALRLVTLINRVDPGTAPARIPLSSRARVMSRRTRNSVSEHGAVETAKRAIRRFVPKTPPPH